MFCGQIQQIHQGIGNKPWALLGDFNSVRYTDEKVEGKQLSFSQLSSFNSFVDHCSLSDIRSFGNKWSWHNNSFGSKKIIGRLDTVLCNKNWIDTLPGSFYKYHSLAYSDHEPILLHFLPDQDAGPRPFRFFVYWMHLPGFQNVLSNA